MWNSINEWSVTFDIRAGRTEIFRIRLSNYFYSTQSSPTDSPDLFSALVILRLANSETDSSTERWYCY